VVVHAHSERKVVPARHVRHEFDAADQVVADEIVQPEIDAPVRVLFAQL
jgi:hypothetical protein